MIEENISQEFGLKIIAKTKNSFLEEIEQSKMMTKKHKKVCTTLNYTEHFLVLASALLQLLDVFEFLYLLLCLVFL